MDERLIREAAMRHRELILPPYGEILDMDGFSSIREFSRIFGGTSIYVPSIRTILGKCIEEEIKFRYNGSNVRELSRKYGYGERHIRKLVTK